jgi:hypothetical protein
MAVLLLGGYPALIANQSSAPEPKQVVTVGGPGANGSVKLETPSPTAKRSDDVAQAPAATRKPDVTGNSKPDVLKPDRRDPNETNRRLMALSERDRRSMFYVTLNINGERCQEVTRTFYQGSAKPSWNAIWNVECRGGPSYAINIMSDEKGSSKVMTCGELRAMGGGECFVKGQ